MKFELVHDCGDPRCTTMQTIAGRPAWEIAQVISGQRSTSHQPDLLVVILHAPGERPSLPAVTEAVEAMLGYLQEE